ncbi:hypothetical protein [Achromobacter phage Motura]|uniref:Uncharacterized protein n=1 Tax=Achromobacter phage Motura TaxID=2591403 RepID=A0A514CSW4_9CAUD|nr:hypothetical protein H1O15_gp211 [Achromobacter phage Motura]QDH83577.1 hypothetical protein [Achromobacter phage Motura]
MIARIKYQGKEAYFSFVGGFIPNWIRHKAQSITVVAFGSNFPNGVPLLGQMIYDTVDTKAGRIRTLVGLKQEFEGFYMMRQGDGVPLDLLPEGARRSLVVI